MDTPEPTSAPAQEQGQALETGNVNDCKSTKMGDTRVALTLTEKVKERARRGRRMKLSNHVSPSTWADAMRRYVIGELSSLQDVALTYGVNIQTVSKRAVPGKWADARMAHVQRVMEQCRAGAMLGSRDEQAETRLRTAQDQVADALMAYAKTMQAQAQSSLTATALLIDRVSGLGPSTDSTDMTRRLASVAAVHAQLVESLRILAGIPNPDIIHAQGRAKQPQGKAQGQAATSQPRGRSKAGPLGADPDAMRTVPGQGEEEGGGGMATVPPGGTGTPHSDPGLHSYGGPTSQSESSPVPDQHGPVPGAVPAQAGSVSGWSGPVVGAASNGTAPRQWGGPVPPVPVQPSNAT